MESPRDNNNDQNVILPIVQGPHLTNYKWSAEFNCPTYDGILAPLPLTVIKAGSVVADDQLNSAPDRSESSRKKRKNEGDEGLFFKLFKFQEAGEQYVLETHKVKTGNVDRYNMIVNESKGRWKVGIHDLSQGEHLVLPVLQDLNPPVFPKKCQLSLEDRLVGWTVEIRKRRNGKEDKFYYHRARQFRSFIEVTTFVLYSCKVKDLQLVNTNIQAPISTISADV